MTDRPSLSNQELTRVIRQLTERIETQEVELRNLRAAGLHDGRMTRTTPSIGPNQRRTFSRARLLRAAGVGAVVAAAGGLELNGGTEKASANDGDPVTAGKITDTTSGTMVNFVGPPGFKNAALCGTDNGDFGNEASFNFPAGVAGIGGGGQSRKYLGVANGVYGYTDNGNGNGVVGYNSNNLPGAGAGVLGLAFGTNSYGVQGANTVGTGVLGSASSPANFAAGVLGHHSGTQGGIGVHGVQDGSGWGGYFQSARGIGLVASVGAGAGQGIYATNHSTSAGAIGVQGEVTSKSAVVRSAGVRGVNDSTSAEGIGVWGSHAGSGWGGNFTSMSGIGVQADGGSGTGVRAVGKDALFCTATTGRAGVFEGGVAQLSLMPAKAATHPPKGHAGDLFVDASHRLWFCKGGSSWVHLA